MTARRRVVITGIGLVTPLGIGVEECWSAVRAGRSGVRPIEGFDPARLPVRIAAEVRGFRAEDWLSRKEALRLDRVLHLALVAAELAVGDAGGADLGLRCGVVVGSAIGGARSIQQAARSCEQDPATISPLFVPNSIPNMSAALVAARFRLRGPSGAPSTACAASTDAVGQGFRLVRDGYADSCLVGGAEACVVEAVVGGFATMRALSRRNDDPPGASRPFDAHRDGFVLGEGAAMLVLEPLEEAVRRGARIYAEVRGYGQSNDAHHMTAPDPAGAGACVAMEHALLDAGLAPTEIDYVNAHATATRLADVAETAAVKSAFGDHCRRLAVSSTKSMTGHLLGATGAVEAAFTALAVHAQWVPPTLNLSTPDPECDLDYVPGTGRAARVRAALSNSFAFGGHNSSLVLCREPPGSPGPDPPLSTARIL